jgi:hypothetical protein
MPEKSVHQGTLAALELAQYSEVKTPFLKPVSQGDKSVSIGKKLFAKLLDFLDCLVEKKLKIVESPELYIRSAGPGLQIRLS